MNPHLQRIEGMPETLKDRHGGTWRYQYGSMYSSIKLVERRPQDPRIPVRSIEGLILRHFEDIGR